VAVFSTREYIEQFARLTPQDQVYVNAAIKIIEQDPGHVDYQRPYLTPHKLRQIHPNLNKQLTVFFELLGSGDIFLRWVNDYKYLHNTWMSFGDDPCFKGLEKFLASDKNLTFDPNVHGFINKVDPKYGDVIFISTTKLQVRIFMNPYSVGGKNFISNSIGVFDLDNDGRETNFLYLDFKAFLQHVYEYFKNDYQGNLTFEIADDTIEQYILDGVINAALPEYWEYSYDHQNNYTIIKMR
jgi:hypothetical protein